MLRTRVAKRQDRPWIALVVLPLVMTATALTPLPQHFWLLVPLVCLTWWWGSVEWAWGWVVGVLEAAWGLQWAYVGIYCLEDFPRHRLLVGVLWAGYAAIVAAAGALNRWHYGRKNGW